MISHWQPKQWPGWFKLPRAAQCADCLDCSGCAVRADDLPASRQAGVSFGPSPGPQKFQDFPGPAEFNVFLGRQGLLGFVVYVSEQS